MIARYAELGGGLAALGDRPPERWLVRLARVHAGRDAERLPGLYALDYALVDHRSVGWAPSTGRAEAVERVQAIWEGSTDVHMEVEEVLACDEEAIAVRLTWEGGGIADAGGGRYTLPMCVVVMVGDGEAVRWEQYEPEDRDGALARYRQLSGQTSLGERAPERFYAEWIRRWDARDLDALSELYAEDWVLTEHRPLAGIEDVRGPEGRQRLFESIIAAAPDARFGIDEVLACDERVIALRATWRGTARDGGGPLEVGCTIVAVVEDGRERRVDVFEPEERQRAIALYAELGGGQAALGDRPPERFWAELARRWATLDHESIVALYAEDWIAVDHRQLGWENQRGREAARTQVRSAVESCATFRFEFDEVLVCDDRVIALVTRLLGTGVDGGGQWEISYGCVSVTESGVLTRRELYDPQDREAMLKRYEELLGSA